MVTYVYRDGSRLTPWMKYCVDRFSAAMKVKFGCVIYVTSGIRTYEEQKAIFLKRYVRYADINGRPVYDTRWWNGVRWYRISSVGTVAVPGTSNHEIQGTRGAVDLRDSGTDKGIMSAGTPRANWARENAWRYGLKPEGYNFREPWHFSIDGIFQTPPASPTSTPSTNTNTTAKEVEVEHYSRDDGKALRTSGLDLAPGTGTWLNTDAKASNSKASNIVTKDGEYQFTIHVYAQGKPGDVVDVVLAWDNLATTGSHSMHYVERIEIGKDGTARRNIPFARKVAKGYAVYVKATASSKNAGTVKLTRLSSDALRFLA